MTATVEPFKEGFGAEVTGVDLSQSIADADRTVIYRAFLDHHLVSIPGQTLTPARTVETARIFGDRLEPHLFKRYHHPETPLILVLSNRVEDGKPKGIADAGTFWHSDVSYMPNPAKATVLYALEVPEGEGDTLFCDLTAAYEALPEATKKRLRGLKAVHNYDHVPRDVFKRVNETPPPDCLHPVVRTHPETGRKAIYVNPAYVVRIEGVGEDESERLKREIFEHCLQDRFRLAYRWKAGDVVAWDNAALMHSATTKTLDPNKFRTLWRTTISGGPTF
jgi:taurine dioxygenase